MRWLEIACGRLAALFLIDLIERATDRGLSDLDSQPKEPKAPQGPRIIRYMVLSWGSVTVGMSS
jgi:hypothetical protein